MLAGNYQRASCFLDFLSTGAPSKTARGGVASHSSQRKAWTDHRGHRQISLSIPLRCQRRRAPGRPPLDKQYSELRGYEYSQSHSPAGCQVQERNFPGRCTPCGYIRLARRPCNSSGQQMTFSTSIFVPETSVLGEFRAKYPALK